MQLGHLQAVLLAQQLAGNQRRARVVAQLAVTVEVFYDRNIRLQLCRQVVLLPDAGDAFKILAGTFWRARRSADSGPRRRECP